jgi:K(+)-stimulated pyrophosphate-energized sodium pump
VLALVAFYPMTTWLMGDHLLDGVLNISGGSQMRLYGCAVIGLVLTGLMVYITEYYTGTEFKPVQHVAKPRPPVTAPTSSPASACR